jgi:hypothetical protein
MQHRPYLVAHVAVVLERLLQSDEGVETVVVLADRDVSADLSSAVDQALGLEHGEGFANGVAGDEEFGGECLLGGQPCFVCACVDLMPQHVGDLTSAVGSRPPERRRFG